MLWPSPSLRRLPRPAAGGARWCCTTAPGQRGASVAEPVSVAPSHLMRLSRMCIRRALRPPHSVRRDGDPPASAAAPPLLDELLRQVRKHLDRSAQLVASEQDRQSRRGAARLQFQQAAEMHGARATTPTLATLAGAASTREEPTNPPPPPSDGHVVFLSHDEKRQARLHAALQQALVYTARRLSVTQFRTYQHELARLLLQHPPRIVPSRAHHPAGEDAVAPIEKSLHRRALRSYLDLLVHHRATPQSTVELLQLCSLARQPPLPRRPPTPTTATADAPDVVVVRLPVGPQQPQIASSWKHSLSLLSWAVQSLQGGSTATHRSAPDAQPLRTLLTTSPPPSRAAQPQRFHLSSIDVGFVLKEYALHAGDRSMLSGDEPTPGPSEVQNNCAAIAATQAALVALWQRQRAVERADPAIAQRCGVERTHADAVRVVGKKFVAIKTMGSAAAPEPEEDCSDELDGKAALFTTPGTPSVGVAECGELLLRGDWQGALKQLHAMMEAASTAATASDEDMEETEAAVLDDNVARVTEGHLSAELCPAHGDTSWYHVAAFFNRVKPWRVRGKLQVRAAHAQHGAPPWFLYTPRVTDQVPGADGGAEAVKPGRAGGRGAWDGPRSLVERRRRVWLLAHLPPHLPRSLVRFEGHGSRSLPFVWRSPAKELLPWFLLAILATQDTAALRAAKASVQYTLFAPSASYAAFTEFLGELLLNMGSLMLPIPVLQGALRELLRPPTHREFYAVHPAVRHFPSEAPCEQIWRSSTARTPSERLARLLPPPPGERGNGEEMGRLEDVAAFFRAKAASLRNYHVSAWLEAVSSVGPVAQLLADYEAETAAHGPPLLSPEAAVSMATAILLAALPPAPDELLPQELRATGGVLLFVVPAGKAFSAASYFKSIYHPSYVYEYGGDAGLEWSCASRWKGSEALLVGRSLRRNTRYPCAIGEAFFRVDRVPLAAAEEAPPGQYDYAIRSSQPEDLTLSLMVFDVVRAVEHFRSSSVGSAPQAPEHALEGPVGADITTVGEAPYTIATGLPFNLIAVYKPAHMNCCLHVGFPNLIGYLKAEHPWRGDYADAVTVPPGVAQSNLSLLHQQGLVNRIDVGTSGIVLVADNYETLFRVRRASIAEKSLMKMYLALVVRCPPPASRLADEEEWYLDLHGFLGGDVLAAGSDFSRQMAQFHLPSSAAVGGGGSTETVPGSQAGKGDRRSAATRYRVLEYFPSSGVYLVEVSLLSGRRHQIRQHFAQIWHPLLGDGRFHERAGRLGSELGLQRPALHAAAIVINAPHPRTAAVVNGCQQKAVVRCAMPADMRHALARLRRGDV